MSWLRETLSRMTLEDDDLEYLYTRGAKPARVDEFRCVTWRACEADFPSDFVSVYGTRGEALDGCLITPYYLPTGEVIGFEARRWDADTKWVSDYRVSPIAKWSPVGIGLTPSLWGRVSDGGDLWLVEGQFDLYALDWVVPEGSGVFATVRAGVTYHHAMFLQRFMKGRVFICYDQDETGRKAAEKASSWLTKLGVRCQTVNFSGGKDPGEIWDSGGKEQLQRVFWRWL